MCQRFRALYLYNSYFFDVCKVFFGKIIRFARSNGGQIPTKRGRCRGKKKLAGFVRVSKGYPEEQRREKAEICRVASCILILGEESAIISMLSIQQNTPVCRNGRRGGLKIPCANNTCGFDPHHRHCKQLEIERFWAAFLFIPSHPARLHTFVSTGKILTMALAEDTLLEKSRCV